MQKIILSLILSLSLLVIATSNGFSLEGNIKTTPHLVNGSDSLLLKNWQPVLQKTPNDTVDLSAETDKSLEIRANGEYYISDTLSGNWLYEAGLQKLTFVDGLLAGHWQVLQLDTLHLDIRLDNNDFPIEISFVAK